MAGVSRPIQWIRAVCRPPCAWCGRDYDQHQARAHRYGHPLDGPGVSVATVVAVGAVMQSRANGNTGTFFITDDELGRRLNLSPSTVERARRRLMDAGFIERMAKGGGRAGRASSYRLTIPEYPSPETGESARPEDIHPSSETGETGPDDEKHPSPTTRNTRHEGQKHPSPQGYQGVPIQEDPEEASRGAVMHASSGTQLRGPADDACHDEEHTEDDQPHVPMPAGLRERFAHLSGHERGGDPTPVGNLLGGDSP